MSRYFNQLSQLFWDSGHRSRGHHKGQVVGFELFGVFEAPLAWLQDDGSRQPSDATGQVDDTWVEGRHPGFLWGGAP